MKRTSKILVLLLTISLLATAFAATVSASSITGITTKRTTGWNNLVGKTASDNANPSGGDNYAFTFTGRWGKIEKKTNTDGNNYLLYTATDKVGTQTPYIGSGYGGVGTTARPKVVNGALSAPGCISLNPYLVVDFDVASTSGAFSEFGVALQTRFVKDSAGTLDSNTHSAAANALSVGSDATGSYFSSGSSKKYVNPYEFTHVTVVYEGVINSTNATYAAYVYVNGEFLNYVGGKTNTGFFEKPHLTWDEVRWNFADYSSGNTVALDNVVTRVINSSYNGNLATVLSEKSSITSWESNIYNAASLPTGFPVASVGDTSYTNISGAIEAGNEITLHGNVYAATVVNKPLTVIANGYTANLVAGAGYVVRTTDTGYVVEEMPSGYEYISGGAVAYAAYGTSFADVLSAADEGTTIKLLTDCKIDATVIINKNITLDLNGKTVDICTTGTKFNGFNVNASKTFTVKSSAPGAKLFSAAASGGGPIFATAGNNCTINIEGADANGNTTISAYGATLVQAWSNTCTLNINGGEYYRTIADNLGFIQLQNNFTAKISNAFIYDKTPGATFFANGRYAAASDSITATMEIDNCEIISNGNVASHTFKEMSFVITNSVISGDIKAGSVYSTTSNGTTTSEVAGKITLGNGNYLNGTRSDNVVLASGIAKYDLPGEIKRVAKTNTFSITSSAINSSTYTIKSEDLDIAYTVCTAKAGLTPALVTWKSGEAVLGYSLAMPGTYAKAPAALSSVELVAGWLSATPDEWNESLLVPDGASEYVLTAKALSDEDLVPTVDLQFGINLLTHLQYTLYIPAVPEDSGIEVTAVTLKTDRTANYKALINTMQEIGGKLYNSTSTWPGLAASLEKCDIKVTFTYNGKEFTVATTVDMSDYCGYVLSSADYCEEQKVLAANVANYIYTGHVLLGGTAAAFEDIKTIAENNTSLVIAPSESDIVSADTSAISAYVSEVQLVLVDYGPKFRFILTEAGKAASFVRLSTGHQDTSDTKAEYTALGYIETNNTSIASIDSTTVSVDGTSASATYTLANYIAALKNSADANTLAFLEAMYGYAKAAKPISIIK